MTGIENMIRWNANFVRGLAQSVLERAKVIRGSLNPKTEGRRKAVRKAVKKAVRRGKASRRSNA